APDGKRIAFVHFRGTTSDVCVMDADGGNVQVVVADVRTPSEGGRVAWRPAPSRPTPQGPPPTLTDAFREFGPPKEELVNVAAPSPDGKRLFVAGERLQLWDMDGDRQLHNFL